MLILKYFVIKKWYPLQKRLENLILKLKNVDNNNEIKGEYMEETYKIFKEIKNIVEKKI